MDYRSADIGPIRTSTSRSRARYGDAAFKAKTGHEAVLSYGTSGQFYTQITQGAPFEVLLSADDARPKKLTDDGLAAPGSSFTYAIGRLVLWSKTPGLVKGEETLKAATFAKLSICNPVAAPYGTAAVETMKTLKVFKALQPKLVEGATMRIGQGLAVPSGSLRISMKPVARPSSTA